MSPHVLFDLPNKLLTLIDEQGSPVTRVELGEISTGAGDWGLRVRGAAGNVIADLMGSTYVLQNDAASPTQGILLTGTRPGGWKTYLDLVNNLFAVNDGTYDRVKTGLIGSYYGYQLRDSLGNLTLDTANSDGRLKLQLGKSTSLAPVVLLAYQNSGLVTASQAEVSLASYSLPANTLATNGDLVRITVAGRLTNGVTAFLNIKFGATSITGGAIGTGNDRFHFIAHVTRAGATSQAASGTALLYGSSGAAFGSVQAFPAETLSGAVTIDFRGGVGGSAGFVYMDYVSVEYLAV